MTPWVPSGATRSPFPKIKSWNISGTKPAGTLTPEVVRAFLEIHDVIVAIREKYCEDPAASILCRLTP